MTGFKGFWERLGIKEIMDTAVFSFGMGSHLRFSCTYTSLFFRSYSRPDRNPSTVFFDIKNLLD